jgi:hypothetical protein
MVGGSSDSIRASIGPRFSGAVNPVNWVSDNLRTITDPKGLVTICVYDGLNNLTALIGATPAPRASPTTPPATSSPAPTHAMS